MAFTIDKTTYDKTRLAVGFDRRPNSKDPTSIVIHSTNSPNKGTSFSGEARFLQTSSAVSAHYLVGKIGQIAQFLDPLLRAWHTGRTIEGYFNSDSIGIETHFTPGEAWPQLGTDALTWLVRDLMKRYNIPAIRVDSHRAVALPKGRKSDPSQFNDVQFYRWRDALVQTVQATLPNPTVIGVASLTGPDQWLRSLLRNNAPLSDSERRRSYARIVDYDMEPSFVIGLIKHEGDFGRSALQKITKNPFNIKAEAGDDRPKHKDANGREWLCFESYASGLEYGIHHLKHIYGWQLQRRTLREIIEVYAPINDGNDPYKYQQAMLENMRYIQAN